MGKVIFEFDEEEDRIEIENIMNRDKFKYALEKVKEYRRMLYKGYMNNLIYVKDGKVLTEEEIMSMSDRTGINSYIPRDDVISDLDSCLRNIVHLLD